MPSRDQPHADTLRPQPPRDAEEWDRVDAEEEIMECKRKLRLNLLWIAKGAAVVAATAGVALAGLVMWGQHRGEARTTEARQHVAAIEATLERRSEQLASRQVLWGEPEPGSAFERYEHALSLAGAGRYEGGDLWAFRRDPDFPPEKAEAIRRQWWPAIAAMRQGARRTDGRTPFDATNLEGSTTSLLTARDLLNMAVVQSRETLAQGDPLEAVRISLDAMTFSLDILRSPLLVDQMVGVALVAIVALEAWPEERLRQLDPRSLKELAVGLERLDSMMPAGARLEAEVLFLAAHLDHQLESLESLYPGSASDLLAYGWSKQFMLAEAVCGLSTMADRAQSSQGKAWPTHSEGLEDLASEALSSGNPLLNDCFPSLKPIESNFVTVNAHLRVLQLAVAVHQRGVDEALERPILDPVTAKPLIVERSTESITIRSIWDRSERTIALPLGR